jgi:hypothetical protein
MSVHRKDTDKFTLLTRNEQNTDDTLQRRSDSSGRWMHVPALLGKCTDNDGVLDDCLTM